jgi:hypothetical protein
VSSARRGPLSLADELLSVGVGVAAGLVVAYLARIWLAREELPEPSRFPPASGRRPAADREAGGRADEGR